MEAETRDAGYIFWYRGYISVPSAGQWKLKPAFGLRVRGNRDAFQYPLRANGS